MEPGGYLVKLGLSKVIVSRDNLSILFCDKLLQPSVSL